MARFERPRPAWVIQSGDARIVVDPAQAADDILRSDADAAAHQEAFSAVLDAAGVPRDSVTHVIATHLDGIGMIAWRNPDGSWVPFFPNAPILMQQREMDAIDAGTHKPDRMEVLAELRDQGAVQAVTGDHLQVTADVALEFTGAHTPGHQIVRINSDGEAAVMLGHLAVSPLHLATGACAQQHPDPAACGGCARRASQRGCIADRSVVAHARRGSLGRQRVRHRIQRGRRRQGMTALARGLHDV